MAQAWMTQKKNLVSSFYLVNLHPNVLRLWLIYSIKGETIYCSYLYNDKLLNCYC